MALGRQCDPGLVRVPRYLLTAIHWSLDNLPVSPGAAGPRCWHWQLPVQQLYSRRCRDMARMRQGTPSFSTQPHLSSCCKILGFSSVHMASWSTPSPAVGATHLVFTKDPMVGPPTLNSASGPCESWGQLRKAKLRAPLFWIRLLYFSMAMPESGWAGDRVPREQCSWIISKHAYLLKVLRV